MNSEDPNFDPKPFTLGISKILDRWREFKKQELIQRKKTELMIEMKQKKNKKDKNED